MKSLNLFQVLKILNNLLMKFLGVIIIVIMTSEQLSFLRMPLSTKYLFLSFLFKN